jgi:outer membrane protein assembly factor BamB
MGAPSKQECHRRAGLSSALLRCRRFEIPPFAAALLGAALALQAANILVSNFGTNSVSQFDVKTGAGVDLAFITTTGSSMTGVAVADGKAYVVQGIPGVISVYNANTGALIKAYLVKDLPAPGAIVVQDGKLYVSSFSDNKISVYNATTGGEVNAALINPPISSAPATSRSLATASTSPTIRSAP